MTPSRGATRSVPTQHAFMTRGIAFAQMPGRMLELFQFNRVLARNLDGRASASQGCGRDSADAPDPRWYGYSVGHWEGDYTFVVDTVGSDERSWLDNVAIRIASICACRNATRV